ncbi:MAG TPA: potassium channel protein [Candidatus Wallbacteria bacterium]|nr:potassium channel protein [Candidatus Wallbacteria bacterium]
MGDMEELRRKLVNAFILIVFIFVSGVMGYVWLEGWSFFDALYMTVITLASVGYGETHELSANGRLFTIFLIVIGMGAFVYAISMVTALIIEGELNGYLRRKKMKAKIDKLHSHYIICGVGSVGRHVIDELYKTNRAFVAIDKDIVQLDKIHCKESILFIQGDASEDDILIQAGIKRAAGLVCALPSDKDNLFIVITAKSLNPTIRIVTRAMEDDSIPKLRKAGADSIVSANAIGGMRMASEMIRPKVVSFLDKMLRSQDASLRVEELSLGRESTLIGKTLREANINDATGLLVIATNNDQSGEYRHNPKSNYVFKNDDVLIVIGNAEQVNECRKKFNVR